jgi:bla regulator protein blaR1
MRRVVPLREGREVEALRRVEHSGRIRKRIEILLSNTSLEPGIFGIARPALVWPEGLSEKLDDAHVEAILAHEVGHVRRRDNLFAAIHMLVEATFWFHPLVWYLGTRLVEEREIACDEEVLELGSDREVYAESILKICEFCMGSPLPCVPGITGADLKKRIVRIMTGRAARKLDFSRKLLLGTVGFAAIAVPVVFGLAQAAPHRAQSATASRPQFDVASIKPCNSDSLSPGARSGPISATVSVAGGRLTINCQNVKGLIIGAYNAFGDGKESGDLRRMPIEGGPLWITSDRYTIDAETEATVRPGIIRGPMMQMLLEDRFKLKIHREARETAVYELTEAKGGPKLRNAEEGSCIPWDPSMSDRQPKPGQKPYCGQSSITKDGPNWVVELRSMSLDDLAEWLNAVLNRPAFQKTSITGKFDFHLEFAGDETTRSFPADEETGGPEAPSLFSVLQQQFGLKIVPTKGPGDFLVIDSVQRPAPN